MSAFVQVVRREIVERRILLVTGFALGLVPLLTFFVPRLGGREGRQAIALMLVCSLSWGIALVLGATIYVRDLADRRLGFYFSRPVAPSTVYAGKLVAAALLLLGASVLAVVPTLFSGGFATSLVAGREAGILWSVAIGFGLVLLPLAHAAGTAIRVQDAWKAFHLPALVLTVLIVAWSGAEITRAAFGPTAIGYVLIFCLTVPVVLTAAGFVQAQAGRTDPVRSHRALSLAAWGVLLPLALVGAGGAAWYSHPSPSAIKRLYTASASRGSGLLFVAGEGSGLRAEATWGFLLDPRNPERFVRTGPAVPYGAQPEFGYDPQIELSRDGRVAAWRAPAPTSSAWSLEPEEWELRIARMEGDRITSSGTGLLTPLGSSFDFTLSQDGSRVALLEHGVVSVVELASGKTLISARPSGSHPNLAIAFVDEDHVRLIERWGYWGREPVTRSLSIFDLDVRARHLERTGEVALGPTRSVRTLLEPSGDRMLVFGDFAGAVSLRDGRTGRPIADLAEKGLAGTFLEDGRIVLVTRKDPGLALRLYSDHGEPIRTVDVGAVRWAQIAGQPSSSTVLLAVQRSDSPTSRASLVVDLATGAVVKELPGLTPVGSTDSWSSAVSSSAPPSPGFFFMDTQKTLVALDLTTDARRTILPR
jgi:hypothetical protein